MGLPRASTDAAIASIFGETPAPGAPRARHPAWSPPSSWPDDGRRSRRSCRAGARGAGAAVDARSEHARDGRPRRGARAGRARDRAAAARAAARRGKHRRLPERLSPPVVRATSASMRWQCVVTLCIALWGTLLAIAIAVPLGLLGARNLSPHPVVHFAARRTMDVLRAVNEFVFALDVRDRRRPRAVRRACSRSASTRAACSESSSARRSRRSIPARPRASPRWARVGSHVIAFGVAPQVMPNFLSYVLLRLESDIRSASVIGMVGGRRHRLLSVGHDPGVQRSGGGDRHPADRRHGDGHRRGVLPHPAGGDLRDRGG